jgi:glycosyltransferase involved in cell wall biosynthesis
MNEAPQLGLIINTWQQPEYLARVLRAVSNQTSPPEEVLLADDGSEDQTRAVFDAWAHVQQFAAVHIWQKHDGFRRSRILNQAIAGAKSRYLVFLDGDTVPHPNFVADHRQLARGDCFVQGHRALVGQEAAAWFGSGDFYAERRRAVWCRQVDGLKNTYRWPWPMAKVRTDLRGVRGCNLAIWRDHLLRVNGYNEAFVGWGREDSELAVRLMHWGSKRLDVRGWALCFHLWHPPASRASLAGNDDLLVGAQRSRTTRCIQGLDQYTNEATL